MRVLQSLLSFSYVNLSLTLTIKYNVITSLSNYIKKSFAVLFLLDFTALVQNIICVISQNPSFFSIISLALSDE